VIGCGVAGDDPQPPQVRPKGPPPDPPSIVSLSPLATRFVIAIVGAHALVGVDRISAELPGLDALASVDLADAHLLGPDLVLLPPGVPEDAPGRAELEARGAEIFLFSPHDLEDVFALLRLLGPKIVGDLRARQFEIEIGRPLAEIGGASFGRPRPRVLGIVGLDPVEFAGGHSFETDLIEIAGGRSVTHGGAEQHPVLEPGSLAELDPELLLVIVPRAPSAEALRAAFPDLPDGVEVEVFPAEAETFWLEEHQETARRLEALIRSIVARDGDGAPPGSGR
jgi:ABC-type Fe3+-hydroxamate transport system substrate-binding protein